MTIGLAVLPQGSFFPEAASRVKEKKTVPAIRRLPAIFPYSKSLLETPKGKAIADTLRERVIHYAYEILYPKAYQLAYQTRAIELAPEIFHEKQDAVGEGAFITPKDLPMRKVPAAEELLKLLGETPDAETASQFSRGIFQRSGMIMAQSERENWNGSLAGEIRKAATVLRYLTVIHQSVSMGKLDGFVGIYKYTLPKRAREQKQANGHVTSARLLLSDPALKEAARMAEAILYEGRAASRPAVKAAQLVEQLELSICQPNVGVAEQKSPTALAVNSVIASSDIATPDLWASRIEEALLKYQRMGLKLKETDIVPALAAAAKYLKAGDFVGFHAHYSEIKANGGNIAALASNEMGYMEGIIAGQIELLAERLPKDI